MKNTENIIRVAYFGGESRRGQYAVNYMIATTENADGDPVELYSEVPYDDERFGDDVDSFDDYAEPILRADIIAQAEENGIDPARLVF